jgi:hypothetical protein
MNAAHERTDSQVLGEMSHPPKPPVIYQHEDQ